MTETNPDRMFGAGFFWAFQENDCKFPYRGKMPSALEVKRDIASRSLKVELVTAVLHRKGIDGHP